MQVSCTVGKVYRYTGNGTEVSPLRGDSVFVHTYVATSKCGRNMAVGQASAPGAVPPPTYNQCVWDIVPRSRGFGVFTRFVMCHRLTRVDACPGFLRSHLLGRAPRLRLVGDTHPTRA
jgi:hypothetical protein